MKANFKFSLVKKRNWSWVCERSGQWW